jgi:hypothetical protein
MLPEWNVPYLPSSSGLSSSKKSTRPHPLLDRTQSQLLDDASGAKSAASSFTTTSTSASSEDDTFQTESEELTNIRVAISRPKERLILGLPSGTSVKRQDYVKILQDLQLLSVIDERHH